MILRRMLKKKRSLPRRGLARKARLPPGVGGVAGVAVGRAEARR